MEISVVNPVSRSIEETRRALFEPFSLGKWFAVGLCAWLASFVQGGGGGGNFNFPNNFGGGGNAGANRPAPPAVQPPVVQPPGGQVDGMPGEDDLLGQPDLDMGDEPMGADLQQEDEDDDFAQILNWVKQNVALLVGIGVLVLVLIIAIGLVFTWLGCRGTFMFIDNIARNRAEIGEPWREYGREANSLFWFSFTLGLITLFGVLAIAGIGVAIAWPDITAQAFGGNAIAAIVATVLLFVPLTIAMIFVNLFLHDFVVPIMYLRRISALEAWGVFRSSILSGHVGGLILYTLFKWVLGIATGIVGLLATCATCCLPVIPYLGTVILLPIPYFLRTYSLAYLEQYGPEFRVLNRSAKPTGLRGVDPEFTV